MALQRLAGVYYPTPTKHVIGSTGTAWIAGKGRKPSLFSTTLFSYLVRNG